MTVNRAQFIALLEPILAGISNDQEFRRRPVIYTQFFGDAKQSVKARETYFERAGLGNFQVKTEGGPVSYTDPIAGNQIVYTHVRRANGYKITQEMIDHDRFREIEKLEMDLQIAGADDLEVAGHLVLNSGFSTTDNASYGFKATGYDGLSLFSTAHTRLDGGATQANRPATDINLGWTALANAITQFQVWVDHRGRPIRGFPSKLVIHPNDMLTAKELLGSQLKPGTANNEINSLGGEGLSLSSIIVSPYLTDTNSWFMLGDRVDTVWHWDVQPRTAMEDDWETEVVRRKRVQGHSLGALRWMNCYGTSGTT